MASRMQKSATRNQVTFGETHNLFDGVASTNSLDWQAIDAGKCRGAIFEAS
jgi:hypothetical protein